MDEGHDPNPFGRHDTAEMPVTRGAMRQAFRINEIFTFLVAAMTAVGAVFGAYKLLLSEARAEADAGIAPVERRVQVLEQEAKQQREDTHEVQMDIRSLYRAVTTGKKQERLEKPPPPPAPKDGGL